MDNKLSYYQICSLARQGQYSLIPSGYKIIYDGHKPEKIVDEIVDGNCVSFIRNEFAKPHIVKISGEYAVVIPTPPYEDINVEAEVEYGEVLVKTEFFLNKIEFYYSPDQQQYLVAYIHRMTDMAPGMYLKKSDLTFDFDLTMKGCCWHYMNVMVTQLDYPDISYQPNGDELFKVDFVCDWVSKDILKTE